MWTKTIIVDKSVIRIATREERELAQAKISYGFAGFHPETGVSEWCIKADNLKLFDNVAEAVEVAKKLMEDLPVEVLTYTIVPQQGVVTITTVKF